MTEELFSPKELAARLKRPVSYVYAMKKRGFDLPGGRATLRSAIDWLRINPNPRKQTDARG